MSRQQPLCLCDCFRPCTHHHRPASRYTVGASICGDGSTSSCPDHKLLLPLTTFGSTFTWLITTTLKLFPGWSSERVQLAGQRCKHFHCRSLRGSAGPCMQCTSARIRLVHYDRRVHLAEPLGIRLCGFGRELRFMEHFRLPPPEL